MAVRTVAPGGGLFASASTWVGGVAPVGFDTIKADATSGNLTLGANTIQNMPGADFTGYTGTLALASFVFSISGGSLILGSSMSITRTTGYIDVRAAIALTSNGNSIPQINGNNLITLTGTASIGDFRSATQWTGANVIYTGTTLANNVTIASPSKLILRPTAALAISTLSFGMNGNLQIDTTQTITPSGPFFIDNASTSTLEITQQTVWASGYPKLGLGLGNTLNINAYTYSINFTEITSNGTSAAVDKLNILSASISSDIVAVYPTTPIAQTTHQLTLGGSFSMSMKTLQVPSSALGSTVAQKAGKLVLGAFTYSVSDYLLIGGAGTIRSEITGTSPSNTTIAFTGNTYSVTNATLSYMRFTGTTPLFYLNNTGVSLSNTTGITLAGAGGGGGSFTFVL